MDKTFIRTSAGIIRLEHISHISETFTEETLISLTNGNNVVLLGEEAETFLRSIPIAIDLSKPMKKEELFGVEVAGIKV